MSDKKYWNEAIETLHRPQLEALQLERLKSHPDFAERNSAWYRQSFAAAGLRAADLKSLDDLRRFPFVNKALERDRQLAKPLLGDMVAVEEKDVVPTASFVEDLGADSLDLVELIMSLEEAFSKPDRKIEIPDEDAEKLSTVGDALRYIEEKSAK